MQVSRVQREGKVCHQERKSKIRSRDICGKCLPQSPWVAYGKEMNSHMAKIARKKLLERATCLGLLEINELVECRSREYLPRGRQSVTKPKKSFLLFFNNDFKALWKEYINHVKNMKPSFKIFGFLRSLTVHFSDSYDRRITMLSTLTTTLICLIGFLQVRSS